MNQRLLSSCLAFFLALVWARTAVSATLVVIAPHPDDGEASCGGVIANTVARGDGVVILTMTGGELAAGGRTAEEGRAIRAEEARKAAAVLGARVEFFGAVDGSLVADAAGTEKLEQILVRLHPATVLAPWPLDVHPDHQASGVLAWRAFQDRRSTFDLYFYETGNSPHTTSFQFVPTDYVDITDVLKKKQEATYLHKSQNPAEWFDMYITIARFRGYEADVAYAEGYIKARNSSGLGGREGTIGKTLCGLSPAQGAAPPARHDQAPQDWAGLNRYREENAGLGPSRPGEDLVVFLGDSITEGWKPTVPTFFAGRPYVDRGIGGQTTPQMLLRFRQDVIALEPKVVVILAGTNDVAGNSGPSTPEMTLDNLISMVELARAHGIRVVLSSVLPAFDFPWRPGLDPAPKIVALNSLIRNFADRSGIVYLDYYSAMVDERGGLKRELSADGVHPNKTGYEVMGPLAEKAIGEALAAR